MGSHGDLYAVNRLDSSTTSSAVAAPVDIAHSKANSDKLSLLSVNSHLVEQISLDTMAEKNGGPGKILKLGCQALLFSAIQQPFDALAQLGNHALQPLGIKHELAAPHWITAPEQSKFGSANWLATTVCSGIGMSIPFKITDGAVCKAASTLEGTRLAGLTEELPMASKLAPLARPIASGALFGFALTPSDESGNFLEGRTKNAIVGGATFGAQRAGTLLIGKGLSSVGTPLTESTFQKSLQGTVTRVGMNAGGGAIAGVVSANSESELNQGRLATAQENMQSVASFAATGGALDALHIASAKTTEAYKHYQDSRDPLSQIKPPGSDGKTGGTGSGDTMAKNNDKAKEQSVGADEMQKRTDSGSEADRASSGFVNSAAVRRASDAFADTMRAKLNTNEISSKQTEIEMGRLIAAMNEREHMTLGLKPAEIVSTFDAVNRLLTAPDTAATLTQADRIEIAKQILNEEAHLPPGLTDNPNANSVSAIMQTLQEKFPGRTSQAIVDLISTGKHASPDGNVQVDLSPDTLSKLPSEYRDVLKPVRGESDYIGRLTRMLALNVHAQTLAPDAIYVENAADGASGRTLVKQAQGTYGSLVDHGVPVRDPKVDTPDLLRIYEDLSGTEKGSQVLKNGRFFVIQNDNGWMDIFGDDTRWSRSKIVVDYQTPQVVKANVSDGYAGSFELAMPAGSKAEGVKITRDVLVEPDGVNERLRLSNPTDHPINLTVSDAVAPDFADMFKVRGWKPKLEGVQSEPVVRKADGRITFSYLGADHNTMSTDVYVGGDAKYDLSRNGVSYNMTLDPGQAKTVEIATRPGLNKTPGAVDEIKPFDEARKKADIEYQAWRDALPTVKTNDPAYDASVERSFRDIYMLRQPTPRGEAIAAGLPWFAASFGRDQLITAMQLMQYQPGIAKDVLKTLAAYQGTKSDSVTDEKPGKIPHELRVGEMARTGEIPFAPYYGTVDATPLWLMLLGRYVDQTGDTSLIKELKPNMDAALKFLDEETNIHKVVAGDPSSKPADGYLMYESNGALSNKGWKDSGDSNSNRQGDLLSGRIALSEAQGYLYDAWAQASKLQKILGNAEQAASYEQRAAALKGKFNKDFWMPDRNFPALSINEKMQQADVVSSNPGHLLSSGILSTPRKGLVADRLMSPDMFNGWGIDTLAQGEKRHFFNSYHNGSLWPHDTAFIAAGMKELRPAYSLQLWSGMNDAMKHYPNNRLPELMGGYPRNFYPVPVPYPVSCIPQAWAAGSGLQMLSTNLGLTTDPLTGHLHINNPMIPADLGTVDVKGLNVRGHKVDLRFSNVNGRTTTEVICDPARVVELDSPGS